MDNPQWCVYIENPPATTEVVGPFGTEQEARAWMERHASAGRRLTLEITPPMSDPSRG